MARKRRKKRRWFLTLLVFIFTPITIWIVAFVAWFFWRDITALIDAKRPGKTRPGISRGIDKSSPRRENKSQEKIPEDDRRRLNEILRNR